MSGGGDEVFEDFRVEEEAILVMVFVCIHNVTDLSFFDRY
jgi:hypothetical protein